MVHDGGSVEDDQQPAQIIPRHEEDVHIREGSAIVFALQRQDDAGVGGTICPITAFSSDACTSLRSRATKSHEGTCYVVPHGRFENTVDTKLVPKRLVCVVGIDKNATHVHNELPQIFPRRSRGDASKGCPHPPERTRIFALEGG